MVPLARNKTSAVDPLLVDSTRKDLIRIFICIKIAMDDEHKLIVINSSNFGKYPPILKFDEMSY
jgi:hypothetical protein